MDAGKEFWEIEMAPDIAEGCWFFRCGCGEPADTRDVLGISFIIPAPEDSNPKLNGG